MTIEEINKIWAMLDSQDVEMQDLGLALCDRSIPDYVRDNNKVWFRSNIVRTAKSALANQSYLLGKIEGTKLLTDGG